MLLISIYFYNLKICGENTVKVDNETENHICEYVPHELSFKVSSMLSGIQEQEGQHFLLLLLFSFSSALVLGV